MLPIRLSEEQVEELFQRVRAHPGYQLAVDLETQTLEDDLGLSQSFEVDPFRRESLLKGLDEIGLTLQYEDQIGAYEQRAHR